MDKFIGNGTTLSLTTSTTAGAGTALGGILNVSQPGGSATKVDTTCLDSTSNYQTAQRGFRDAGDMTFDVAYNQADAGWAKALTMDASGVIGRFIVSYASTSLADEESKGYIASIGREIPRDGMITRSITMTMSSGPGFV